MSRKGARGVPPAGHSSAQTAWIPQHSQREDGQQPGHAALLPPGRPREGAANLSPGPGCAAPAGRGRSSAGCPRAARSRSKPSHPPTRATAPPPRPGWPRAPAPRGPLRGHGGWAGVPVPPPPHAASHPHQPRSAPRQLQGLSKGAHHLYNVPGLLQAHLSAGKHAEPLLNGLWHRTRGFHRLLLRDRLKAEGPCPASPPLPCH